MLLDKFAFCPSCGSREFLVNDERSKRCSRCGFTYYLNASAAYVALIVNERGELLVARRKNEPAKGTLDIPGGFADPNETAEEGVAREVREETGLEVLSSRYLFSLPNSYMFSGMAVPTLDLFFLCEADSVADAEARDDVDELMWIAAADIRPADFGLLSIRKGVERFIREMKKRQVKG
jgi:NAD+ diphosphatase